MPTGVYVRTAEHGKAISAGLVGVVHKPSQSAGIRKYNEARMVGSHLTKTCPTCGVEFPTLRWQKHDHCSIACFNKSKIKRDGMSKNNPMFKEEVKTRQIATLTGRKLSAKHVESLKESWRQCPNKDARIHNMLSKGGMHPNGFEVRCMAHMESVFPGKFEYVGDGSMMVNHRSADAYSKELNTVALFHGCYWHLKKFGLEVTEENKRSVEKVDSLPFLSAGYKVIFIWEDELNKIIAHPKETVHAS